MKKSTSAVFVLCCLLTMLQLACGGGPSNPPSRLKKRAFVANGNGLSSTLLIVDALKDQFTASSISILGIKPVIVQPGANNTTLVFSSGDNGITIVDNTQEKVVNTNAITLPGNTESFAETSDAKTIYAAIRSASQVAVSDAVNDNLVTTISVPAVRRIVLAHNNSKILAFSDGLDSFTVIKTADNTTTKVCDPACPGVDRPTYAIFTSDDSKAYVLSCGAECGGAKAAITVFDMTANPPAPLATVPVDAATFAIADSTNVYVAGSTGVGTGKLDIVPLTNLSGSGSAAIKSVTIGDGFHNMMSLASNNKLFVGARTCTTGCLAIVDLSAGTAVVDQPFGDVTGMAPISGRNVVYVTEGGELRIFDTTTSALQANQLDVVGTASGVVSPDQ